MKRFVVTIVTLAILGWFVWAAVVTQDVGRIFRLVRSTRFSFYVPFLVLNASAIALASTNLFLLLLRFKNPPKWKRLFELDLLSLFGAYYTPGGSGGMAFLVYMLNKEGVDPRDSSCCLLLDKLITLFLALCSLFILVLLYVPAGVVALDRTKLMVLAAVITGGLLLSVAVPAVRLKLRSVYVRIAVFRHHPWIVLANVLITTGIFLLSASQFLLAFKALDVHAPDFSRLLVSYGPISIMGYLPFTVSGAGVSEALAIAIWTGPKVGSEEIIAAFVIARLFTLISTFLLPSVIYAGRFGRARLAKLSNSHANRF